MRKIETITSWDDVPLVFDLPIMCRLLGRSYENIKQLCQKQKIPAFKVGTEWRFEKDTIQGWMKNQGNEVKNQ